MLGFTVLEFRKSQKVLQLKKIIDPEYSGVPEVVDSLGIKNHTGDTIPELRLQLGTVLELKSQALIDNLIRQMLSHRRRPGGPSHIWMSPFKSRLWILHLTKHRKNDT